MKRALSVRIAAIPVCALLALALAACGDDGAGSQGENSGFTQTAPVSPGGGTAVAFSVQVTAAQPASGNGTITGSTGSSAFVTSTVRRVTANASSGAVQHRITVDYDPASGSVIGVVHAWGASAAELQSVTGCARIATVVGDAVCGTAVVIDPSTGVLTFRSAVLRGSGVFTSTLNGQLPFSTI
jgi:hypothetical protein